MSNQFRTEAIILRRTNYGEADRILNFITPDSGKVSAIAKGVRRPKSKLAGGLELFATSDVTILTRQGSELGLVTSAKLIQFYGNILKDYDRLQLAYELIKIINKTAETVSESEFYYLLRDGFLYLDVLSIDHRLVEIWFRLGLANALGTGVNLTTNTDGDRLSPDKKYDFDFTNMAFTIHPSGQFTADHIKFLRLIATKNPAILRQVSGLDQVLDDCLWLVRTIES